MIASNVLHAYVFCVIHVQFSVPRSTKSEQEVVQTQQMTKITMATVETRTEANNNSMTAVNQEQQGTEDIKVHPKQKQEQHIKQLLAEMGDDTDEIQTTLLEPQMPEHATEEEVKKTHNPKKAQEEHINTLLAEMEKLEHDRRPSFEPELVEVVDEMMKRVDVKNQLCGSEEVVKKEDVSAQLTFSEEIIKKEDIKAQLTYTDVIKKEDITTQLTYADEAVKKEDITDQLTHTDEMIKKEDIKSQLTYKVETQVSDSSSTSTYPEVFPLTPEAPVDVRSLPFPKPSQSVDSPLPRSTVSSFKPSANSRPDSLELPPPPPPQEVQSVQDIPDPPEDFPSPPKSPISPGAFSYTQGMFPNVGSPKVHRVHKGQSPMHEEAFPKMGSGLPPQYSTVSSADR